MAAKRLAPETLFRSWLNWFFFNGPSQSGERMQGIAFAHSMAPIIRSLYGDDAGEVRRALKRHLMLFNVEPQVGSVIHGITAAMEEQRANGADIDDDSINTVKVALMGPLSGIGDTLVPGTLIPILLAIAIGITNSSGALGPVFYAVVHPLITALYSWRLYRLGYDAGVTGIQKLISEGRIGALTDSLTVLGLIVMGALSAAYINVTTPLRYVSGKMTLSLQGVLDSIMPGILSLVVIWMVFSLLRRKKSPMWVVGFIFAFALVGTIVGIF